MAEVDQGGNCSWRAGTISGDALNSTEPLHPRPLMDHFEQITVSWDAQVLPLNKMIKF